ncbi:MAG: hypothetical protein ACYC2O_06475 [Microthrixaceae bacterium]
MIALLERPEMDTTTATPLSSDGAFEQIMRRATQGAVLREARIQIAFDESSGNYHLGVAD